MVDSKFIITPALRQALATAELAYREDISDDYSEQEAGWTHLSPRPDAFQDLIDAGLLERDLVGQSRTPMYRITPDGITTLTALRQSEQVSKTAMIQGTVGENTRFVEPNVTIAVQPGNRAYTPFIEDFGAESDEPSIPEPLTGLEKARDQVTALKVEISDLLQYAQTGSCGDEECSDLEIHTDDGLALFNRLGDLYADGLLAQYLTVRNAELSDDLAMMDSHLQAALDYFQDPAKVNAQEMTLDERMAGVWSQLEAATDIIKKEALNNPSADSRIAEIRLRACRAEHQNGVFPAHQYVSDVTYVLEMLNTTTRLMNIKREPHGQV